jgi:DNA-binding MarR family transcriptional regulator
MVKTRTVNLSDSVIHLLHRASQQADQQLETAMSDTGLTARQLVVLDTIARLETPNQTDICDATGIDRSTLADMVKRLSARRLIVRRRDRNDARAYNLRLTEEGERALEKTLPQVHAAELQITGKLSESRRKEFLDLLKLLLGGARTLPARKPVHS